MVIEVIDTIDVAPIVKEYERLKDCVEWVDNPRGKQSALQHLAGRPSYIDACGRLDRNQYKEKDFCEINGIITDSVLARIIENYKLYRTRFMIMKPKSCYTLHNDFDFRIHIPLITNSSAMFVFLKEGLFHLEVGKVYKVDTRKIHSFANFGLTDRLHLVGCV